MTSDRIDAYLDDLLDRLEGAPSERRRTLAEAEAHLRDSADAFLRRGMDADSAQSAAIAAFGDAPMFAKASNRRRPAQVLAACVRAAAQLGGYGFAAIGAATLLARALTLVTSTQWVYGASADYPFTAAQCAHWLAVQPGANTCGTAAALESSDDSFLLMLATAILGLMIAGMILGGMRLAHGRRGRAMSRLPGNVIAAIGATAFLGAGLALLAAGAVQGRDRVAWGHGVLYADGAVALIFGLVFLGRFLLTIRPVPLAAG